MELKKIKFTIDQLRKDKIIYATEATSTGIICVLSFLFANCYFENPLKLIVSIFVLIVGIGYTIFMGIGNFFRLQKIKELEKKI